MFHSCTVPRVEYIDARVLEVPNVARRHRHAAGTGNRPNLAISQRNRMPKNTARRYDLRVGAGRVTINWQHSSGKQAAEGTLARPRRRLPAGSNAIPVRTSASVTAVTNSSRGGRSASINSETILVSTTTIADTLLEARRFSHRFAGRKLQFNTAEGLEQFVDRRP